MCPEFTILYTTYLIIDDNTCRTMMTMIATDATNLQLAIIAETISRRLLLKMDRTVRL